MASDEVSGAKLLEELWARPEDRQVLAVYADWLAQRGQSARAEYMQLRLIEKPTKAQLGRLKALRSKTGTWLGPARPYVRVWE